MDYESYLSEQEEAGESKPELKTAKRRGLWDLLSTMKFAIWILVALGILSVFSMFAGELLPKEQAAGPGGIGRALLDIFQMHDPFRSWWYRLLLGVLCLSLFACILERLPIIWRLWTKEPPTSADWLRNIHHGIERSVVASREALTHKLHGWNWRLKSDTLWIGEHGRVAMWGPLFTHIGLLLLGVGALAGSFGGVTERAGGFSGETVGLEGQPFIVRIDSFRINYYPLQPGQWVQVDGEWVGRLERQQSNGSWLVRQASRGEEGEIVPVEANHIRNRFNNDMDRANIQRYSSWVTVIDNGQEVRKQEVAVNSPLRYKGYRFYQSSYDPDNPRVVGQYDGLRLALTDSTGQGRDTLTLKPGVEMAIPGDTLRVTAGELLPHFKLGQQGAYSESAEFVNPAVQLTFHGPRGFEKTQWAFLKFPAMEQGPGRYGYRVASLVNQRANAEVATIFEIKHTHGGWILWAGFLIGTLGLLLSSYFFHRVLYVEWPAAGKAETRLTGLSRKTGALFARQLDRLIEDLNHTATP
jgi:cytochrome c biogenesis protein